MNHDPAPFYDRFCLFFDFLGSRAAATAWPRERLYEFVDLLRAVVRLQGPQKIDGESFAPEITTFSDLVVVSYLGVPNEDDAEDFPPMLDRIWTKIVCQDAIRILSGVAEMGLRIGLLIRGGLSFGQLYHDEGVVFGKAKVDAYKLESCVSSDPRIVVSEGIVEKLNHGRPEDMDVFLRDADGKWHLNYFEGMVNGSRKERYDIALWKAAHLERIDKEIKRLREDVSNLDALKVANKWEWFKERFKAAISLHDR
jgi:hypothetical protein